MIKYLSYLSIKTYVLSTQKNRLIETVLLSTHNLDKEIITFLYSEYVFIYIDEKIIANFCLSGSMVTNPLKCGASGHFTL